MDRPLKGATEAPHPIGASALKGATATSHPGRAIPPPAGSGGLPRALRPLVEALADCAIPPGRRVTRRAGPLAVERLDQLLAELPRHVRLGLVFGLWLLELTGLLIGLSRFSRLAPARQGHLLERWHRAGTVPRALLRGLLTPIKAAFYAEPEVAAALGYLPRPQSQRPDAVDEVPPGDVRAGRTRSREELRCEVAIVGSGAGGAVVARELAERGRRVVLVEEGQYWTRPQFDGRPFSMQRQLYRDLGFTAAIGRPWIPVPVGRTVGGTTTINSGTCFRLPERTLERWRREEGLSELTSEALAPHFARVEERLRVQPVAEQLLGQTPRILRRGAEALGIQLEPLRRNADGCEGSGVCCFGCPQDAKRSTNVSYIPQALLSGATLYTETRARRLLVEGGRAVGLDCEMGPERTPLRLRADAVVVAAGALHTPLLLAPLGVGRRSGLLGRHLSLHPATKVTGLFGEPVRGWEGVPQGVFSHALAGEGIALEGISMTPDFTAVGLPFFGERLTSVMDRCDELASFGLMVEDESRGSVRRGPGGGPVVFYQLGRQDLARLLRGIDVLCRIFLRSGAERVFPPIASVAELTSEAQCDALRDRGATPGELELSAFHPLGSCRLANDPRRGVLDPDLEAWGLDRLFVADGSIFPSSLGVNPQLAIMAFATRAAERIDARLGGDPRRFA